MTILHMAQINTCLCIGDQQQQTHNPIWLLQTIALDIYTMTICVFVQVGNGDIVDVSGAVSMLQQTGCDGLMIGRGALQDPLIFKRIKQHFAEQQDKASSVQQADVTALSSGRECEVVEQFLRLYASHGFDGKADRAEQTLVRYWWQL